MKPWVYSYEASICVVHKIRMLTSFSHIMRAKAFLRFKPQKKSKPGLSSQPKGYWVVFLFGLDNSRQNLKVIAILSFQIRYSELDRYFWFRKRRYWEEIVITFLISGPQTGKKMFFRSGIDSVLGNTVFSLLQNALEYKTHLNRSRN